MDWWHTIKVFLAMTDGTIKLLDDVVPYKSPRVNNIYLMVLAANNPKISTGGLKSFNQTRIYWQIIYLSEICNDEGSKIDLESWNITKRKLSPILWLYQPTPTKQQLAIWKKVLTQLVLPKKKGRKIKTLPRIQHKFGPWKNSSYYSHTLAKYTFSPSLDSLLIKTKDK